MTNRTAWIAIVVLSLAPQFSFAGDCNDLVLEQVKQMPKGGRYSVSHFAKIRLQSSAHFESGKFFIIPAGPSFCSGATYLVFIRTIEALREHGQLSLDYGTLERLIIRDQRDGEGVWGRWNANGPGTARLFHELRLGRNFDNIDQAKPGDFMKIFWSRQVGRNEHGHSTIFLGMENRPDGQYVRYWSSNIPSGYGEKSVPRSKIAYAIFSRLETPANLARITSAPSLTRIWPLFSEVARVFQRLARSAGYSGLLINASSGAAVVVGAQQVRQRNALAFRKACL